MNEPKTATAWQLSATVLALLLCGAWIAVATWARWSASQRPDAPFEPWTTGQAVGVALTLGMAAVVLSRILGIERRGGAVSTADMVTACMFAVIAAAHIAVDAISPRDAAVAWVVLVGIRFTVRPASRWLGVFLLGIACAASLLAAGALLVVSIVFPKALYKTLGLLTAAGIAIYTLPLLTPSGTPWANTYRVSDDVARVGPSFLWTLTADWADLTMPAIVLALLAVSDGVFGRGMEDEERNVRGSDYGVMAWLLVNVIVGACMPRLMVTHGFLFALPAFLLAPAGWRVLRRLPFDRAQWSLSIFSAASYALLAMLVWVPVRKGAELIMAALWVHP